MNRGAQSSSCLCHIPKKGGDLSTVSRLRELEASLCSRSSPERGRKLEGRRIGGSLPKGGVYMQGQRCHSTHRKHKKEFPVYKGAISPPDVALRCIGSKDRGTGMQREVAFKLAPNASSQFMD
jgi:hypothetical protein